MDSSLVGLVALGVISLLSLLPLWSCCRGSTLSAAALTPDELLAARARRLYRAANRQPVATKERWEREVAEILARKDVEA